MQKGETSKGTAVSLVFGIHDGVWFAGVGAQSRCPTQNVWRRKVRHRKRLTKGAHDDAFLPVIVIS